MRTRYWLIHQHPKVHRTISPQSHGQLGVCPLSRQAWGGRSGAEAQPAVVPEPAAVRRSAEERLAPPRHPDDDFEEARGGYQQWWLGEFVGRGVGVLHWHMVL